MEFRLRPEEYVLPNDIPYTEEVQREDYLQGHRAGWFAFADGMQTTLTDDGYQRGKIPGLAAVRPKDGSEAKFAGFDAGFQAAAELNLQSVLQAGSDKPSEEWQSPVGEPDRLDMILTKDDGTIAVILVVARPLEVDDTRTAAVFEEKLRNYCKYIQHRAFADEFGPPSMERVKLVIRSDFEVPEHYIQLFARVAEEEKVEAGLEIHYE